MASSSASAAVRRSTRQQSREVESAVPTSPARGRGRPRITRSASPPGARLLADVAAEAGNLQHDHGMFVDQAEALQQSPGGRSDFTSRTVANMEAMQSSGVAENLPILLPDLHSRSGSVLHMLIPSPKARTDKMGALLDNLQRPDSVESVRLRTCEMRLRELFARFSNSLQYIVPELVLKATLRMPDASNITLGAWRPDAILQKANLAALAADLIPLISRTQDDGALQRLDNFYPQPFLTKFFAGSKNLPAGTSKLGDATFKLGMSIRSQLAITRLIAQGGDPTYSPDQILRDIFYNNEGDIKPFAISWNLREGMLPPAHVEALEQRCRDLHSLFSTRPAAELESLDDQYSWLGFKQELVKWIRDRVKEIDDSVGRCDGADEISRKWEVEIQKMSMQGNEPRVPPSTASEQRLRPVTAKRKRASERHSQDEYAPAGSPIGEEDEHGDPAALGSVRGRDARGNVNSSVPVDPQLEAKLESSRNEAFRNSGIPRFVDAQMGAQKIAYDDSQLSQLQQLPTNFQKRRRPNEPDNADPDASQDVGFQNDEQSADMADARRQGLSEQQTAAMLLQNEQQEGQGGEQMLMPGHADPFPVSQQAAYARQASTPAAQYLQTQAISKTMTSIASKDRPPQQRKAWTGEEIDALIAGIATFGNCYSKLKEEDSKTLNHLPDRDPESLRHKARNMKFDYLKAGIPLPGGFDKVLLDRKFKDKLEALGVPYHQDQARRAPAVKTGRRKAGDDE